MSSRRPACYRWLHTQRANIAEECAQWGWNPRRLQQNMLLKMRAWCNRTCEWRCAR